VVSIPGQSGFTRFVKLPPVEEKQVPEIVRFEAEQQIPFSIDEVIWRWQSFRDPDSPDIEVGIFAMKRSDVWETLSRFENTGVTVDVVQMSPLALYNFMEFDGQVADNGATLLVDVGADKTDIVVADGPRIWTRTLQLGGNNFTEVLVKAFKLDFNKAEKLKRTAGTSKYARQVFQAMRPVFAELTQEIQRSVGYYTSLHRESRFRRVVALGNGFRLPGLQKYIEQNLGIPVVRVDSYEKLSPSPALNAPAFTENILSFAAAYGLALQGLGVTRVQTNLLPSESARRRLWDRKRPGFAAAAAMILVAVSMIAWRAYADSNILETQRGGLTLAGSVVGKYDTLRKEHKKYDGQDKAKEKDVLQYKEMMGYRNFVPTLTHLVSESIKKTATDQGLMTLEGRDRLMKIERSQRRVIMIASQTMTYHDDLSGIDDKILKSGFTGAVVTQKSSGSMSGAKYGRRDERELRKTGGRRPTKGDKKVEEKPATQRGYLVYLSGSIPLRRADAVQFIGTNLRHQLGALAEEFPSVEVTLSAFEVKSGTPLAPDTIISGSTMDKAERREGREGREVRESGGRSHTSGQQGDIVLDPLTGEYAGADSQFYIGWKVLIKDDGLPKDDNGSSTSGTGGKR
jgi:type IV pilus assembly protein PilM